MCITKIKRGFTLIELLVVIAIIGILASVVLASLNTASEKAKEGAARAALSHARSGAEIAFGFNNASFANICPTDTITPAAGTGAPVVFEAIRAASLHLTTGLMGGGGAGDNYDTGGGTPNALGDIGCQSDNNEYFIQMYISPTKTICFDSNGFAGDIATAKATNQANGVIRCD